MPTTILTIQVIEDDEKHILATITTHERPLKLEGMLAVTALASRVMVNTLAEMKARIDGSTPDLMAALDALITATVSEISVGGNLLIHMRDHKPDR